MDSLTRRRRQRLRRLLLLRAADSVPAVAGRLPAVPAPRGPAATPSRSRGGG